MYGKTRLVMSGIAVSGLAVAALAATSVAPASAKVNTCRLEVNSVKALDLQDRNGTRDEVFLKLGDTRTDTKTYELNQTRHALGTDNFQGSESVRILEEDTNNRTVIGSTSLPCVSDSGQSDVAGAGAIYRVTWNVLVIP